MQLSIVRAILDKRDVFAVLPTVAGKSLTYQLPPVIQDGVTIVISPLVAIIKDQLEALERLRVSNHLKR